VVDFTTKTENEIYDILTQSDGNTCGRFTTFQLQHPIRKTEINNGWFNWRAIAASLAALLAFEETEAQQSKMNDTISLPVVNVEGVRYKELQNVVQGGVGFVKPLPEITKGISGKVIDAKTKEPLCSANVYCKDDRTIGTVTDASGGFILLVDSVANKNDIIVVQSLGYATYEIPVAEFYKNGAAITMEISMAEAIMGLSVVELPSTIYGKLKKAHRLSKRRKK
jgi:hypothetical protein